MENSDQKPMTPVRTRPVRLTKTGYMNVPITPMIDPAAFNTPRTTSDKPSSITYARRIKIFFENRTANFDNLFTSCYGIET